MACELKHKMIGGEKWSCMQMSATRALALESRIFPAAVQIVGPLVGALGQSNEVQSVAINQALSSLAKVLPPAEFASIIRELCEEGMVNGQRVDFEQKFSGDDGVVLRYQVAWFVLEANFSALFRVLVPDGAAARAKDLLIQKVSGTDETAE